MRSGLRTYGGQHIVSLAKTSHEVRRIVGFYDACEVAERDTEEWLRKACEGEVTVQQVIEEIWKENKDVGMGLDRKRKYSIV